jgi:serine/threonine protein kinase
MRDCPACRKPIEEEARFCPYCGSAAGAAAADPFIGRIVNGKFRVEALVGHGGMGRVYRARHLSLDRSVVLKLLHPSYSSDPQIVQRFQREARAASKLNHPNSIAVLDFGEAEDGTLFMAMEHLGGRDLARLVAEESPLGEARIVRIVAQVLSALAEAHAQGVIHRDVKPENVMVESRRDAPDFVKVLDFGIAKITALGAGEPKLTEVGLVCGTPEYMSPEQAHGAELDARSDLYSVGVILYQLATGELPFSSETPVGFLTKHLSEAPLPPRQRRPDLGISPALDALVAKALEKDPAWRFQTADEMRAALLACAAPREQTVADPPAPPPRVLTLPVRAAAVTASAGRRRPFWIFTAIMIVAAAGGGVVTVLARQSVAARKGHPDTISPAESATATPPTNPVLPESGHPEPGSAAPGAGVVPGTGHPEPGSAAPGAAVVPETGHPEPGSAAPAAEIVPEAGHREPGAVVPGAEVVAEPSHREASGSAVPAPRRVRPSRDQAAALFRRAEGRRAEQDVDGAIRLYLQAEAADPSLAEVQKKLALCYQLRGDTARAAERYRRYLATDPDDASKVRSILESLR